MKNKAWVRTEEIEMYLYQESVLKPEVWGYRKEKQIPDSVADVIMFGEDIMTGIEIKSDTDRLGRLKRQIPNYSCLFDLCVLAIGHKNLEGVKRMIKRATLPDFWGIWLFKKDGDHVAKEVYRVPKINDKKLVRKSKLLELLWNDELHTFLHVRGVETYGLNRRELIHLCDGFSTFEIRRYLGAVWRDKFSFKKVKVDDEQAGMESGIMAEILQAELEEEA